MPGVSLALGHFVYNFVHLCNLLLIIKNVSKTLTDFNSHYRSKYGSEVLDAESRRGELDYAASASEEGSHHGWKELGRKRRTGMEDCAPLWKNSRTLVLLQTGERTVGGADLQKQKLEMSTRKVNRMNHFYVLMKNKFKWEQNQLFFYFSDLTFLT